MLDNIVYFLNIIWTYCTCMYYVSEINEYYYYYYIYIEREREEREIIYELNEELENTPSYNMDISMENSTIIVSEEVAASRI